MANNHKCRKNGAIQQVPPARLAHSIRESCALLGVSRATLYRLIKSGSLRTVRSFRRPLIARAELERLLQP
jgi:excisionase family DNA binding protein